MEIRKQMGFDLETHLDLHLVIPRMMDLQMDWMMVKQRMMDLPMEIPRMKVILMPKDFEMD